MSNNADVYRRRWEESQLEPTRMPVEEVSMEPETKNGIVCNAKHVNVRKQPFKTAEVLGTVREGEKVTILGGPENGFYKIELKGDMVGFLSSNFCKEA